MSDGQQLISWRSSNVYENDLMLLENNQWLNDRILTFVAEYVAEIGEKKDPNLIHIFGPTETEMIKTVDEGTLTAMFGELGLRNKNFVAFIVNDNLDPTKPNGGSHWSLLVFYRLYNMFIHLDSMKAHKNWVLAKDIASKMSRLVGQEGNEVKNMDVPRQQNCYDCGVFVAEFLNIIVMTEDPKNIFEANPDEISASRQNWASIIKNWSDNGISED